MGKLALATTATSLACAIAGCTTNSPDLDSATSALDISAFTLPTLTELARAQIVHRYDSLDPTNVVPRGLLEDAIIYYDVNKARIPKPAAFVVVDLSLFSGKDRFWIVNTTSGAVESHHTAHGDGSDPDNDGYATLFSNVEGSHKSSLGFYLTAEIYDGTHRHSMRLDGLSIDGSPNDMANTNVRERLVVVHEASYVDDNSSAQQGRSNGCLALDPSIEVGVVDRIHDGTLLYVAIEPLNTPVGRALCGDATCDGTETADSCAADCAEIVEPDPEPEPADNGGCSTAGGGSSLLLGLALVGLRRRRRRVS